MSEKTKKYKWKGHSKPPVPVQVIGEEIQRIEAEAGSVTPHALLERATDPDHPMHVCFEWDDTEAANKYRIVQARELLRFVCVVYETTKEPITIRAFVTVENEEKNGREYRSIGVVMEESTMRQQMLDKAIAEHEDWEERYSDLQELASVFKAAEDAKAAIRAAKKAAKQARKDAPPTKPSAKPRGHRV